jgi:hypothetical protein
LSNDQRVVLVNPDGVMSVVTLAPLPPPYSFEVVPTACLMVPDLLYHSYAETGFPDHPIALDLSSQPPMTWGLPSTQRALFD